MLDYALWVAFKDDIHITSLDFLYIQAIGLTESGQSHRMFNSLLYRTFPFFIRMLDTYVRYRIQMNLVFLENFTKDITFLFQFAFPSHQKKIEQYLFDQILHNSSLVLETTHTQYTTEILNLWIVVELRSNS